MNAGKLIMFCTLIPLLFAGCEKVDPDLIYSDDAGKWKIFTASDGFQGTQVAFIKTSSRSDMWFSISGHGVARLSGANWAYYNTSNSPILNNYVSCIEESSDGTIFFGTSNGFSMLGPDMDWSSYQYPGLDMDINTIKCMKDRSIWIGTKHEGLFIIEDNTISQVDISSLGWVNDFEQDSKGNIWIATDSGLIKYDGSNTSIYTTENGLPDDIITSLFYDSRDRLWIGTFFGRTAAWMQGNTIIQLPLQNNNAASQINDMFEDRAGNIWFATWNSGLLMYDGVITRAHKKYNGFPEDDVICIGEGPDGSLWFGLYSKGLIKYSLPLQ